MTDKQHAYDPDLPYVVLCRYTNQLIARFVEREEAEDALDPESTRIIDTTPKPRVPDDAKYIMWWSQPHLRKYMARRGSSDRWHVPEVYDGPLEDLPGVTPDTVFTVLDAREERKTSGD